MSGTTTEEYAELLDLIKDAAMVKLRLNAHRGDIREIPIDKAMEYLYDEIAELQTAIDNPDPNGDNVILEAGDVANWVLTIVNHALNMRKSKTNVQRSSV